jgi:hypothetical protein
MVYCLVFGSQMSQITFRLLLWRGNAGWLFTSKWPTSMIGWLPGQLWRPRNRANVEFGVVPLGDRGTCLSWRSGRNAIYEDEPPRERS